MSRRKEAITLSIPIGTKAELEAIADRLGARWGQSPSISRLLAGLASGQYLIGRAGDEPALAIDDVQTTVLKRAAEHLIDLGDFEGAKFIRTLLLSHGNLREPLRRSLLEQAAKVLQAWRPEIEDYQERGQPFYLLYTNGQGQDEAFTVRFSRIVFHEKRHYLQAWCDEVEGGSDLPELRHNRCFRFDRIRSVGPASGEWRGELGAIAVELRLTGGLVRAYESKGDDLSDEIREGDRYVRRLVHNVFWLFREILPYGAQCELLGPIALRRQFGAQVSAIGQLYADVSN